MKSFLKITIILAGNFLLLYSNAYSQFANTKVKSKHEAYTDSLKQVEYNYIFPFLGQGAYKKGFDIPYPAGGMFNYIWMKQNLVFENMQLGFTGTNGEIPLTNVDDFVKFGENTNISQSFNVRPDLWILPFVNLYGIFGYGISHTEVNLTAPIALKSVVDQNFSTSGVGLLFAGGVGPIWISTDLNWTWNKPELLEEAVQVRVVGVRVGHTFVFKHKPQSNFGMWVGAQGVKMAAQTVGSISLKDALPPEFWDKKDQFVDNYWAWYEQQTPIKQAAADRVLTPIVENIDNRNGEGVVQYAMDKRPKEKWSGTIGFQYQTSKRWQFRTEAGLIGNRKSVLASVNYRFLL